MTDPLPPVCRWIPRVLYASAMYDEAWDTTCSAQWTGGDPSDLGMHFCCYCGGVLEAVAASDPDADEAEHVRT